MRNYIPFTKEMKENYTILAPNMLPMHFKLIMQVLKNYGYKIELLQTEGEQIIQTGLKYVHNDTCYPAILVIGQFIDAIQSGKYDPKKTALILFQTGGGCRASNYIFLLRKALQKAGYGYIPVISFSLAGLEKHPGFRLTLPIYHRMLYAVIYADLLMSLVNQVSPYEKNKGEAQKLADKYIRIIADGMEHDGVSFKKTKEKCREILDAFAEIPTKKEKKVQVGVVGEIYVKYSPLGNNNLNDFLVSEGAEVTVPGLLDFCMYCVHNMLLDYKLYRRGRLTYPFIKLVDNFLMKTQLEMCELIRAHGRFKAPTPFGKTLELGKDYISHGCKMGEGWLLTSEMLELAHAGVKNIVCTQPFGCLPNHICGKGMMKPIKDKNPDINIVAIDYDASASRVNQENRIKLMLSNARDNLERGRKERSGKSRRAKDKRIKKISGEP